MGLTELGVLKLALFFLRMCTFLFADCCSCLERDCPPSYRTLFLQQLLQTSTYIPSHYMYEVLPTTQIVQQQGVHPQELGR